MNAERQQLLWLGTGLLVIGTVSAWRSGVSSFPVTLLALAVFAYAGVLAYRTIGRGVFLLFTLAARAIGAIVSWIVVLGVYVLAIGSLGSILKLFGMNWLDRDFEECKRRPTMFVDVAPLPPESFRRQS